MKQYFFLALLFTPVFAEAQDNTTLKNFINPATVNQPKGYSHAVTVDLGNCLMVVIAGQVALDSNNNVVGKGNFEQQATQIFKNIQSIIQAAGGKMNDLVKLNYYILDMKNIKSLRKIRDEHINIQQPPASTLVQVSKLFRDDVLLEIEATAFVSKTGNVK